MFSAIILIVVYAVLAISIGVCLLLAFKKGLIGAAISLGVTIGSAIISFIIVYFLAPVFSDFSTDLVLGFMGTSELTDLLGSSEGAKTLIGVLCGGLILPIVFVLVYVLLQIIGSIVFGVTSRKLPRERRKIAMAVGAVRGIVLTLIILFPIMAIFTITDTIMKDHPAIEGALSEAVGEETVEELNVVTSGANVPYFLFKDNLVKLSVEGMTHTSIDGENTNVYMALNDIATLADAGGPLMESGNLDFLNLTAEQKAAMYELLDAVDHSALLSNILADAISACSEAWANGETYMGMSFAQDSGAFSDTVHTFFVVMSDSHRDTVISDLRTLLNVLGIIADLGIEQADRDGLLDIYKDGGFDSLLVPLEANAHMRPVAAEIKTTCLRLVAENAILNQPEDYHEFVGDLSTIVSDSNGDRTAVSDKVGEIMGEHGLTASDESLGVIADALIEKQNAVGSDLSEEDVADVFLSLAEKYENGEIEFDELEGAEGDLEGDLEDILGGSTEVPVP